MQHDSIGSKSTEVQFDSKERVMGIYYMGILENKEVKRNIRRLYRSSTGHSSCRIPQSSRSEGSSCRIVCTGGRSSGRRTSEHIRRGSSSRSVRSGLCSIDSVSHIVVSVEGISIPFVPIVVVAVTTIVPLVVVVLIAVGLAAFEVKF